MTAPDPRPGGCLHGPGAQPGVCPNCGTIVPDDRPAASDTLTCECGHSLDRHVSHVGCVAADRAAYPNPCTCSQEPSQIAADAVAAAEQRDSDIEALIEASSLGTPEAKAARESVPREVGSAIALAARYLGRAEAAEQRAAEVEGKVRALADEVGGLESDYGWIFARLADICGDGR